MPKVSVIIPAYNAMPYLPETITNLLKQISFQGSKFSDSHCSLKYYFSDINFHFGRQY